MDIPKPIWISNGETVLYRHGDVEQIVADNVALRQELGSLISQFHHAMKDAGWHPGRTDDNLCDIIREKGKELKALQQDAERYRWLRLPNNNVPISHEAARDPVVYDAAIDAARKDAT